MRTNICAGFVNVAVSVAYKCELSSNGEMIVNISIKVTYIHIRHIREFDLNTNIQNTCGTVLDTTIVDVLPPGGSIYLPFSFVSANHRDRGCHS